jgi:hypothetical protein
MYNYNNILPLPNLLYILLIVDLIVIFGRVFMRISTSLRRKSQNWSNVRELPSILSRKWILIPSKSIVACSLSSTLIRWNPEIITQQFKNFDYERVQCSSSVIFVIKLLKTETVRWLTAHFCGNKTEYQNNETMNSIKKKNHKNGNN